jgi:hypothetical protein
MSTVCRDLSPCLFVCPASSSTVAVGVRVVGCSLCSQQRSLVWFASRMGAADGGWLGGCCGGAGWCMASASANGARRFGLGRPSVAADHDEPPVEIDASTRCQCHLTGDGGRVAGFQPLGVAACAPTRRPACDVVAAGGPIDGTHHLASLAGGVVCPVVAGGARALKPGHVHHRCRCRCFAG